MVAEIKSSVKSQFFMWLKNIRQISKEVGYTALMQSEMLMQKQHAQLHAQADIDNPPSSSSSSSSSANANANGVGGDGKASASNDSKVRVCV
jgi:hypothetical protein